MTIIGTGNFELNEELREVVENGPLDDDREKCALNLTPVFVFTCISSLYLIIFAITFKLDNRLKVEEKYKPKIVH